MRSDVAVTVRLLAAMTVLCGVIYPAVVTGVAGLAFPHQAQGSLVSVHGQLVGSELIGQAFSDPGHFWPRPSATQLAYNAMASGGSNDGPLSARLRERVADRIAELHRTGPTPTGLVPVDLVTASGSGLDPHTSLAAAYWQVPRVAHARGLSESEVRDAIAECTEGPQWGLLGEPRVNVLALNLKLDGLRDER